MGYVALVFLDLGLAVAVLGLTAAAAQPLAGRQAARRVVPLLLAALCAVLARAGAAIALGGLDRAFAERRLAVGLPLVALPLLVALVTRARTATVTACAAAAVALLDLLLVPSPAWTAALALLALAGPVVVLTQRGSATLRAGAAAVPVLILAVAVGASWWSSRLPDAFDMGAYAATDLGGGPGAAEHAGHGQHAVAVARTGTSVDELTGPRDAPADVSFELTAATATADGREALAFNGTVPGPQLMVVQGALVEAVLHNADVENGVSIHWHGVDVPNAEDGVAGVTQDAVAPGGSHTYRFVAEQAGTYWYHSHQRSAEQVAKGLYGALVVLPRTPGEQVELDLAVVDHAWRGPAGFTTPSRYDEQARLERVEAAAGTTVRLRLVNTDSGPRRYRVDGAPYRLAAVDGTDLVAPTPVDDRDLRLAGGGRYDLLLEVGEGPVTVHGLGGGHRLVLGEGDPATHEGDRPLLDLAAYGSPAPTLLDAGSGVDRDFVLDIDRRVRFQDGRLGWRWTVNGQSYPRMPMLVVREGDLVRTTIVNRSTATHPMHLHGHHVLVLERNGEPVTGSPWWSDSLDVAPGERYVVAFRADNPGIWMDHCHDLGHAADGFVLHLAYEGVTTPYELGGSHGNAPE